jgi:hypothetical protein
MVRYVGTIAKVQPRLEFYENGKQISPPYYVVKQRLELAVLRDGWDKAEIEAVMGRIPKDDMDGEEAREMFEQVTGLEVVLVLGLKAAA